MSTCTKCKHYVLSQTLRSSGSNLLFVPCVRTGFRSRSFSVAAPSFGIPFHIFETVLPYPVFATNLKPSFTKQLFGLLSAPFQPPAQRLRFGWPMADVVRFTNSSTYLLTYLLTTTLLWRIRAALNWVFCCVLDEDPVIQERVWHAVVSESGVWRAACIWNLRKGSFFCTPFSALILLIGQPKSHHNSQRFTFGDQLFLE